MNIYKFDFNKSIKDKTFFENNSILLLGEFEIFHNGHMKLFEKAKEIRKQEKIGILIIDKPNKKMIQSEQCKLENLATIGFDFVIVCEFNFEFMSLDGRDFIKYLDNNFNVNNYVVGQDFRFGKGRKYSANDLEEITKSQTSIVDIEKYHNQKISSTKIIQMYEFGEFNVINEIIPIPIQNEILFEENKMIWQMNLKPHFGIYYCLILIDEYWYHGIIHFSINNSIDFRLVNYKHDFIINQKSRIKILDILRIIVNSRFDKIETQDIEKSKQYFSY